MSVGLFLGSLFYSVVLCVSLPVPYCFDYSRPVIQFEVREYDTSSFVQLKIALPIQGLLWFHTTKFYDQIV